MLRSRRILLPLLVLAWSLAGADARALPLLNMPDFEDRPGPELYEVYNLLAGTSFGSNSDLMPLLVPDETWTLGSSTGIVLVGSDLGMANMNSFGFYTPPWTTPGILPQVLVAHEVFSMIGPLGVAGPPYQAEFFPVEGEVGFYLQAAGLNDQTWHSQSDLDAQQTSFDHMASFELPDGIVLQTTQGPVQIDGGALIGWEDLDDGNPQLDGDYNDLMLVVGTLTVIPEPGTAALLAAGLLLLARARRMRRC